jgi:hypothetical protein
MRGFSPDAAFPGDPMPALAVSDGEGRASRHELVSAMLLAAAVVATAWSSYEATRWNGEQAKTASKTNAVRIDAARAAGRANFETQVDVTTFSQWIDAFASGDQELTTFYFQRFRPEFGPAVDAWIATRPRTNPSAPRTPFAMPQYRLASREEAERLDAEAESLSAQVRQDIQRASNYVLAVVLFAVSLFFAGMSTKLTAPRLRLVTLVVGCTVFTGTLVWIATFPISLSV